MVRVLLSPDVALPQYERLRDDRRQRQVLERVDEILDALEVDPGRSWLRTHRFHDPPLWCVTFTAAALGWAILWSLDGDERVLVHYIGPASFA